MAGTSNTPYGTALRACEQVFFLGMGTFGGCGRWWNRFVWPGHLIPFVERQFEHACRVFLGLGSTCELRGRDTY